MKKDFVKYYFERLDFWKKELRKKGYTEEIFKKAQQDVKKYNENSSN